MIKIIIADDHSIVREGLKKIISTTPNVVVTDEASDGMELLRKVQKNRYDIAVLDIKMPGMNVLDLIKTIKNDKPKISILVLSMYPEEQYAARALKAGASGYLTKESAPKALVNAIQKIAKGGTYISEKFSDQLVLQLNSDEDALPHDKLSDREYQVFRLIAAGQSNKVISEELNLSDKTVSTYRVRILQKLNLKNNAEITHYAFKYGLVDW